jgi:hypothetical protein
MYKWVVPEFSVQNWKFLKSTGMARGGRDSREGRIQVVMCEFLELTHHEYVIEKHNPDFEKLEFRENRRTYCVFLCFM